MRAPPTARIAAVGVVYHPGDAMVSQHVAAIKCGRIRGEDGAGMAELLSIILAAGEGTRMRSAIPKVLHPVGGLPMVSHAIRAAQAAGSTQIAVVIGTGHDEVRAAVATVAPHAAVFTQAERHGTAHAVQQAREAFAATAGNVIVLYADTPLVSSATVATITAKLDAGADIVVVGFEPDDPIGYGRLLTEDERLVAIREHKDATAAERAVGLVNSGIMGFRSVVLASGIDRIGNANAKGEFYLTDAVEIANADGRKVEYTTAHPLEVIGVDDRTKLAKAEAQFQDLRRN